MRICIARKIRYWAPGCTHHNFFEYIIEPTHEIVVRIALLSNKCSCESAHSTCADSPEPSLLTIIKDDYNMKTPNKL